MHELWRLRNRPKTNQGLAAQIDPSDQVLKQSNPGAGQNASTIPPLSQRLKSAQYTRWGQGIDSNENSDGTSHISSISNYYYTG
jgi:hypothetical protein